MSLHAPSLVDVSRLAGGNVSTMGLTFTRFYVCSAAEVWHVLDQNVSPQKRR